MRSASTSRPRFLAAFFGALCASLAACGDASSARSFSEEAEGEEGEGGEATEGTGGDASEGEGGAAASSGGATDGLGGATSGSGSSTGASTGSGSGAGGSTGASTGSAGGASGSSSGASSGGSTEGGTGGGEEMPTYVAAYGAPAFVGGSGQVPEGVTAVRIGEGAEATTLAEGEGLKFVKGGLEIRVPFPARGKIVAIAPSGDKTLGTFEPTWTPGGRVALEGRELLAAAPADDGRVVAVLADEAGSSCALATISGDEASLASFPCPASGVAGAAIVATPAGAEAFVTSAGGAPELFRVRLEAGALTVATAGVLVEAKWPGLLAVGQDEKGIFAYAYGREKDALGAAGGAVDDIGHGLEGALGVGDGDATEGAVLVGPGFLRLRLSGSGAAIDQGPVAFDFDKAVEEARLEAASDGGALLVTRESDPDSGSWEGLSDDYDLLEARRLAPGASSLGPAESIVAHFDDAIDAYSVHRAEDGLFAVRACGAHFSVFFSDELRCETYLRDASGVWSDGPVFPLGAEVTWASGEIAWAAGGEAVRVAPSPETAPGVVATPDVKLSRLLAGSDGALRPLVVHEDSLYAPRVRVED